MVDDYYSNWQKSIQNNFKKAQNNFAKIHPSDYTCGVCGTTHTSVLRGTLICYYCNTYYAPQCCGGKYGTCKNCWEKQTPQEQRAQKKRYRKTIGKGLKLGFFMPIVIIAALILGLVLRSVNKTLGMVIFLASIFSGLAGFIIMVVKMDKKGEFRRN